MDIIELFNDKDINTRQPLLYKTYTTFLVNYTDISMLIDSSKSILLQTPSAEFVKVSGKLGVGIEPGQSYSLHVLGDTCISGSIISNGTIVSSNINKLTTDTSFLFNITNDISTSLIRLYNNVNDLSVNYYTFKNITINDISKIKTDISSGFKYSNDLSVILLDLSINHYTLKNSFIDLSSRHYSLKRELDDLSASKASLQSEVNILTTNLISVSNELYDVFSNFIYSIKTGFWGTLEFIDNSMDNLGFSINDLQFRVEWLIEWPTTRLFRSNYNSLNTNYTISRNDRLYSLDSSLIIQVKSIYNNSFSTTDESETLFVTQPNISISSEFLNNDSIKQITLNLANIDTIDDGIISIYYNPLYKGFFGTLLLTNNNAVNMIYNYAYNTINGISFESSLDLLTSNTNYSITISNEVRVKDNNTPLVLALTPDVGYDISVTALLAKSINSNIEPLRVFSEGYVGYQLNLLPFNSNLEDGLIGLSFEVYKTGFFGTLALANKTSGSRFDYSYNYISIKDSSINKITQTVSGQLVTTYSIINYSYYSDIERLSGQELSNNSINSENRLAYATSPLNLSLLIYDGYDISVNALSNTIIGISNNILTTTRTFDPFANINYNYNIIPLSSNLVNGLIGLSFEMYRTGFFGTFALGNKTAETRFDYSYNYISISGSNVISRFITSTFTSTTQISIPSNAIYFGKAAATKFAKITNNGIFKAAFGSITSDQGIGAVYYWSGTTANNQLVRLDASNAYLGIVVSIDNNGSYIVAGSLGSGEGGEGADFSGGAVIWSTTPPYSSVIINYPQDTSGIVTTHISGNGKRVFLGIVNNDSIYAYSHTDLSLAQIEGAITHSNLMSSNNTFSVTGFASDNSGNYLITSAFGVNNYTGLVILYHFNGSMWVQSGNSFAGTATNDNFGYSIDMNCGSGIVCCAGAPNATPPYVKIYQRLITTWSEFQRLDGTSGSGFGTSVSLNESGLILYVTTTSGETFYYTRSNNNEQFTLTSTIPSQEPIEDGEQVLSTNSSGNQVIIVKTSSPENPNTGFIYYFDNSTTTNIQTLSGQEIQLNSITSENRLRYATSPLNLSLVIADGYDVSVNALPNAIIGISNNILTSPRLFDTSNNINYNYNIIPLSSYLFKGNIGLSFEMYRTGFFGTFALGNKTASTRFDYSYNYINISGSNVNSIIQTLSGQALINNSITSENRLPYANSPLNLSLVIYNGYDISVNALSNSIVGISNNILTNGIRTFGPLNINYNYNIIPLTSFLLGGTIGLSFELYRTGFFGTFALGNKTAGAGFDYSYNYISISGSNVTSGFTNFILIKQISPPSELRPYLGGITGGATKFAKTTNTTFKAAIGVPQANGVYYWSGTTISNEFILLNSITDDNVMGNIVGIDNAGQYIVSGGYAESDYYGGRIWSTTPPYNSTRITYPFSAPNIFEFDMSVHISGNGQRVFVGSRRYCNIYAFSHTDLSLTQIGGAISADGLYNQNSSSAFSDNGFASDNSANYLITSAYLDNYALGYVVLYRFNDITWVQTNVFYGDDEQHNFGYSIDMNCGSGEWCCAGAPCTPLAYASPYVKIYKRNTTTNNWAEFQTLVGVYGSGFGTSISLNETGSRLYITTTYGEIFYYTRPNNSELFTLTSTIPIQQPTSDEYKQFVSTNSSGNQVILVKSSPSAASAYYFELNKIELNGQEVIINSANRLAYADSPLNLSLLIYNGYDISVNALPSAIVGISNNILTSSRLFNTYNNNINYNYNIIPLSSYLVNGTIGLSFEMYRTGFFGTFALGNKTGAARFDYSYNYISISGSNVNSIIQTLSGVALINNDITSANRLAYADSPLNLSLVIADGYDVSVNALPNAIIGISNNILTSPRLFNTSNNINYNYNIIPLSSYLFGGNIGLSFEMYRTGFFGTFALGNKTASTRFDYSYNYISISGSNVNSIIQTLSGQALINNSITSENRLPYANSPLNLSLVIAAGYDISVNALSNSIVGISNNILTSTRLFNTSNNINYNYNIIPLTSFLLGGTIGLSFEMYRTGFFGAIVLTNNGGSTIDYSYNYISINSSTIYSPLISLNNGSSNTRTISGELRLRDASNQIAMNIRTASSEADISYSINGGTINTFVITTISSYKHSNFNILPNINNLINGTLTFNVLEARTGWYGDIVMELHLYISAPGPHYYNYTIYKGSTSSTPVLTHGSLSSNGFGTVVSARHTLSRNDRLENASSTFFIHITSWGLYDFTNLGNGFINCTVVQNWTGIISYNVTPQVIGTDVILKFVIYIQQ